MTAVPKAHDMEQSRRHPKRASGERAPVLVAPLSTYGETVPRLLHALGVGTVLAKQQRILIKPNLIEARPPPVTTDVACVEAVVAYCREVSGARIIVADGSGGCETSECFEKLGYNRLEEEDDVELVDLDLAKTVTLADSSNVFLTEFQMPEIVLDSYVISVPVLKAHSMTGVTLGTKNMMGVAPEKYYGAGGHYKKWGLHKKLHRAIIEINRFKKPDLTLIDAAIGMAKSHLWGPKCDPPVGRLIASYDPVAADVAGCKMLGKDWRGVQHLVLADGVLGQADAEVRFIGE